MEIKGKVTSVSPMQTGEGKNGQWKKNGMMVVYKDGEYEKSAYIQGFNKSADAIEQVQVGDEVTVQFNVESREYNGKFYTDLRAWKVEVAQAEPAKSDNDMPF